MPSVTSAFARRPGDSGSQERWARTGRASGLATPMCSRSGSSARAPLASRVLVLLVAGTLGGCSIPLAEGPPPNWRPSNPEPLLCTSHHAWPIVDTLVAGLFTYRALALAWDNGTRQPYGTTTDNTSPAFLNGLIAVSFALSAGVGWMRVSDCNDALDAQYAEREASRYRPVHRKRPRAPVDSTSAPAESAETPQAIPPLDTSDVGVPGTESPTPPTAPEPAPAPAPAPLAPPVPQQSDSE